MQLDVGMELTFRLVHVIYKCICTDKHKDAFIGLAAIPDCEHVVYLLSYELLSSRFLSQTDGQTDRQKATHNYELTVLIAQVSSKMQLDVDMSSSANTITFRLGLTQLTFDPDPWRYEFWSNHRQTECDAKTKRLTEQSVT